MLANVVAMPEGAGAPAAADREVSLVVVVLAHVLVPARAVARLQLRKTCVNHAILTAPANRAKTGVGVKMVNPPAIAMTITIPVLTRRHQNADTMTHRRHPDAVRTPNKDVQLHVSTAVAAAVVALQFRDPAQAPARISKLAQQNDSKKFKDYIEGF